MKNKGKELKEQKKSNFYLVHTEKLFEVLMSFGALELPDSDLFQVLKTIPATVSVTGGWVTRHRLLWNTA